MQHVRRKDIGMIFGEPMTSINPVSLPTVIKLKNSYTSSKTEEGRKDKAIGNVESWLVFLLLSKDIVNILTNFRVE